MLEKKKITILGLSRFNLSLNNIFGRFTLLKTPTTLALRCREAFTFRFATVKKATANNKGIVMAKIFAIDPRINNFIIFFN